MIDALIAVRLYGQAEERTGQSESAFVTCKVRVATDDGDTIFCNVIAFDDDEVSKAARVHPAGLQSMVVLHVEGQPPATLYRSVLRNAPPL